MRARPPIATSAVQKLEAKRLQALTRQREKLEAEVQGLEKEILDLVSSISGFSLSLLRLTCSFCRNSKVVNEVEGSDNLFTVVLMSDLSV
jgi:hypothetical protein